MGAYEKSVHSRVAERLSEPLNTIAEALERLRYGTIQLTVHDGKVMQVDVTERRRFAD
jgi:hypothetical protein